ncbi:MAG: hypothetical protein AB7F43_02455 [Bacteriovoracia bacterium]
MDEIVRAFNTALLASKIRKANKDELSSLLTSEAFQSILLCVRDLANRTGLPEEAAAEQVINTFRELDRLWDDLVFQEGMQKLKNNLTSS